MLSPATVMAMDEEHKKLRQSYNTVSNELRVVHEDLGNLKLENASLKECLSNIRFLVEGANLSSGSTPTNERIIELINETLGEEA